MARRRFSRDETRTLLDSIETETETLGGLRDRALIGVLVFSFARIGAAIAMKVEDYYPQRKRWWLRLHEQGGKRHDVPCHHTLEEYLDAYLTEANLWDQKKGPLFRTFTTARAAGRFPSTRSRSRTRGA